MLLQFIVSCGFFRMNFDKIFKLSDGALQFLFGGNCDFCGEYLTVGDHRRLCASCLQSLSKQRREFNLQLRCGVCSHPLNASSPSSSLSIKSSLTKNRRSADSRQNSVRQNSARRNSDSPKDALAEQSAYSEKKVCPACMEAPLKVAQANALFPNTGLAKKFCYDYKFQKHPSYAHLLARWIVEDYGDFFSSYDVIVVVVLGAKGRLERGFCQVTEVVKRVSRLLSIPYLCPVKRVGISSQHTLGKRQRRESLPLRFFYREKYRGFFDGKKVLIVDDICSSGATINYFASLLEKNNHPKSIGAFFFARSLFQDDKNQKEISK